MVKVKSRRNKEKLRAFNKENARCESVITGLISPVNSGHDKYRIVS
jgi:hypothetical protein